MKKPPSKARLLAHFSINEDWLAVIIAAMIVIFSVLGILGPNGIPVRF